VLAKELVVAPDTCLFATMTALSILIKFTQFRTTPEPHQLMQEANPMPQFGQFCRERESKYEKSDLRRTSLTSTSDESH